MSADVRLAVMNFFPRFCPGCGKSKLRTIDSELRFDAGEGRECKCGVTYQRAWTSDIIDAAGEFPGEPPDSNQPVPEVRESDNHEAVGLDS